MISRLIALIIFLLSASAMFAQEPGKATFQAGKGLRVTSQDSSSYLKFSARMQNLIAAQTRIDQSSDWETNLLIRRFRLKFDGYVFSPKVVYKMELGLSNRDISPSSDFDEVGKGSKIILDAVVKWKVHKRIAIWAGQTKLPGNRERLISSQKLQFVDRSLVNSRFNIDRDIGIQLHTNFNIGKAVIRPIFSWAMGEGRNIIAANRGGFDYTGRIEILPMGKFTKSGDYVSADIYREEKPKLAIAASVDFNDGATRQRGQLGSYLVDTSGAIIGFGYDLTTTFIDLMFKYQGLSIQAEYAKKSTSPIFLDANGKGYFTGQGVNFQVGYLFPKNYEIAARYTYVDPVLAAVFPEASEYTIGASKYFLEHNLKIQADASLIDLPSAGQQNFRFRLQCELAL